MWEAADADEAPKGVTTCLHRGALAAGNSDTHSQLRVWDCAPILVRRGRSLRDSFSLPSYVKEYGVCARRLSRR